MSVRRDTRNGRWLYRKQIRLEDGRRVRIFGVPTTSGLPDTKAGADQAERDHIARVLRTGDTRQTPPKPKEVPTVREFEETFMEVSRLRNKQSTIDAKGWMLKHHLLPRLGELRLDQVTYAVIEDLKIALAKKPIGNAERRKDAPEPERKLSPKTINNCLTVLRRMLVVARKRGIISSVPEVEWLKTTRPEFDFLDFEEGERLVKAAAPEPEWRAMILTALRTGMRMGELLALRWQDVDLIAGRITLRQNAVNGKIGTPKSGKPREIALSEEARLTLKGHRHLKGPLVFCDEGGRMLTKGELRHPLLRACKRAGLREIGWHVLRHTFASHLVMRGAPIVAVQDLMGHSTIQMTMRYAHLAPHVTREAVQLLDRRDSPAAAAAGLGGK